MSSIKKYFAALLLISIGLFAGCSSGPSPKQITQQFLAALQNVDYETAQSLSKYKIDYQNTDEEDKEMAQQILSKVSFELSEAVIDEDKATVKANVTSLDLVTIVGQSMSEMISMAFAAAFSDDGSQKDMDSFFEQYLNNKISDPKAPMTTTEVDIKLVQTENGWKIAENNEDLFNAVTGNLAKAFSQLESGFEDSAQTEKPDQKMVEASIGDKIELESLSLIINSVSVSDGTNEWDRPKDGHLYVIPDITIENVSNETINISSMMQFTLMDGDGYELDQSIMSDTKGSLDGQIAPGRKIRGEIAWEVPINTTGLELIFIDDVFNGTQVIVKLGDLKR